MGLATDMGGLRKKKKTGMLNGKAIIFIIIEDLKTL